MTDFIIIAILAVIIVFAGYYLYKEKKKGRKCVGCPYADSCAKKNCEK